jgi:small subunit ribosomal protein S2
LSSTLVRNLIEAGIHFGHPVSRWNPKMSPYILGRRNGIHIVNIKETLRGLLRAQRFITRVVAGGKDVLFVGTKRQAREAVETHAKRAGMHFVSQRWLGGTLTNFRTIRSRLARLEELEAEFADDQFSSYSKKRQATLLREKNKIQRNLDGIRRMDRLPGALVVIDVGREHIAVKEAKKLGIPTVCLIDTDSDPDFADIPIPGNDDGIRSIDLVVRELANAALEGAKGRPPPGEQEEPTGGPGPRPGRPRGRRGPMRAARPMAGQAPSRLQPSATPEGAPAQASGSSDTEAGASASAPSEDESSAAEPSAAASPGQPAADKEVAG